MLCEKEISDDANFLIQKMQSLYPLKLLSLLKGVAKIYLDYKIIYILLKICFNIKKL